jgi:hypothetical protein
MIGADARPNWNERRPGVAGVPAAKVVKDRAVAMIKR